MSVYAVQVGRLKSDLEKKERAKERRSALADKMQDTEKLLIEISDAQKLLASIAEENTEKTLSFITGIINKALSEIFPDEKRIVKLKKTLYSGSIPHINLELETGMSDSRDLKNSGKGLRQIISVLFQICLIEIRKTRRILVLDECLSGLHKNSKRILGEIISIFADKGFQFIFVEYGLNNVGKLYNVERVGEETSEIYAVEGNYNDEVVSIFTSEDADLSVLGEKEVEADEDGNIKIGEYTI